MHVVYMRKLPVAVLILEVFVYEDDKRTLSHETRLGLRNSAIAFQRPWKGSFQLYDPFQMKGRRQAMP